MRRVRLDWVVTETRTSVDPGSLGVSEVIHYSIPAVDELGVGRAEPASEVGGGKLLLRGGEVLVSKLNPRLSRVLVAQTHEAPAVASSEFVVLRPGAEVDADYLVYLLSSEMVRQALDAATMSATRSQQRVRPEILTKYWLLLPSRNAQRAIGRFLDAETARIDALVAKKVEMLALLDERFSSEVFHATTHGLHPGGASKLSGLEWVPSLPHHWSTPRVSTNFDLQLGKMVDSSRVDEFDQFPYLRNANVQWDRFQLEDLAVMSFSPEDRLRLALRPGDVLICEGGEVGRAAVWAGEVENCYFQKAVHRARPRHGANGRFLMYALRAAAKMNVFAVEGNLSTIVHLTGEQLAAHRLPWPPEGEQGEIVEYLDGLSAETDALRRRLERQIELLEEHRRALITRAVTGEMHVPGAAA